MATPNSPHRVYVALPVNASKVQAFGPWFQPGVHPNAPTHFNVDCRDAGEAELKVKIVHEETKVEIPCRIIDNEDQTYSVEVVPPTKGAYTTTMTYGGQPVPLGQKVMVEQTIDVSKIKVDGLEPSKYLTLSKIIKNSKQYIHFKTKFIILYEIFIKTLKKKHYFPFPKGK